MSISTSLYIILYTIVCIVRSICRLGIYDFFDDLMVLQLKDLMQYKCKTALARILANIRKYIRWSCRSEFIQLNLEKFDLGCKPHRQLEALNE